MAHAQREFSSDVGEQELLPGIPDHLTIQNIAPKIPWKTCNVLQMVSWGWQQAIYNRSVYNSKLFSKSTEGFLIFSYRTRESKLVLILYTCKDGSSLQLPPPFPLTRVLTYDCICLDGKVYLWVVPYPIYTNVPFSGPVEVCVLDLAGDRKWAYLKPLKLPYDFTLYKTYSYGVLDGKIYRFLGYLYPTLGVLSGGLDGIDFNQSVDPIQPYVQSLPQTEVYNPFDPIRRQVHRLPRTEVYNPLSDVWSSVTPMPLKNPDKATQADLERHLACFSEWATKQMEADISKKFLTNGSRYESYYSEWRQGHQAPHSGPPSIRDDCWSAMANQVYYRTPLQLGDSFERIENIFFCGGQLLKFNECFFHVDKRSGVLQKYNTEENSWESWKSFSINENIDLSLSNRAHVKIDQPLGRELWQILDWVYADNAIWAIISALDGRTKLLKSTMLLEQESNNFVLFNDTLYSIEEGDIFPITLRPIYI